MGKSSKWGSHLVSGALGGARFLDGRGVFRANALGFTVLEQQQCQFPAQVPFDMIDEGAKEDMGAAHDRYRKRTSGGSRGSWEPLCIAILMKHAYISI